MNQSTIERAAYTQFHEWLDSATSNESLKANAVWLERIREHAAPELDIENRYLQHRTGCEMVYTKA